MPNLMIDTTCSDPDRARSRHRRDALGPGPGGAPVGPGLIDLHTHTNVYWGGTPLGKDAVDFGRHRAATTWVDTCSAGLGNFARFRTMR